MLGLKATEHVIKKSKMATGAVLAIERNAKSSAWSPKVNLFNAMVTSTLFYAFPVWGIEYIDKIETVQADHFRRILNLPRSSPNHLLRLELGLTKLSLTAYKLALKFLIKILELEDRCLAKICFLRQLELCEDPRGLISDIKYNWAASFKEILPTMNISHIWANWDPSV